jgi:hypothetical protein
MGIFRVDAGINIIEAPTDLKQDLILFMESFMAENEGKQSS